MQKTEKDKEVKTTKKAVILILLSTHFLWAGQDYKFSLLVPGLEQIKKKKYTKGILLAGTFVGFITGAIIENRRGYQFYDKYRSATSVDSVIYYRNRTQQAFKERNIFILAAITVWSIHILDVSFSKKKIKLRGKVEKNKFLIAFSFDI